MMSKNNPIEICVLCGKETPYHFNDHIDFRYGYVEGAGQLCKNCYEAPEKPQEVSFTITENFIKTNSNDQDLGEKIRRIYWKIKDKLS